MANTLLTPTAVTREALRILHQRLNFIGSINRQYDDSFARTGAKIGDQLKIRLPNKYTVRTGRILQPQDATERSVTLAVGTQKGVDLNFTSAELTLSLDDFSKRVLTPAMNVLAANIEFDALGMYKEVYQQANNQGLAGSLDTLLSAGQMLTDALAPEDGRTCNINTRDNIDLVKDLKGLFHDDTEITKQYRTGRMGHAVGFDFMQNTLWPRHTVGTGAGYLVNGGGQTGPSIVVDTGTGTLKKGDILTIAGVNRVQPETRSDTGQPQQFVVAADHAGGAGTIAISPAIITSGPLQTVSGPPADNAAVTLAGTAGVGHGISMAYHEDAFAFATADLEMPRGVDFSAREMFDGISMRIVRAYDINGDQFPCRIDVFYGYAAALPELAARLANR